MANNIGNRVAVGGATLLLSSSVLMGFLARWEGTDPKVYADPIAHGVPTACLGITNAVSPYPVIPGEVWSAAKCQEVGQMVVSKEQIRLASCLKRTIDQPTFDALSSHAHNNGIAATCASRAVALINQCRHAEGCDALAHAPDGKTPVWSYVKTGRTLPNGKYEMRFVQGLYDRRLEERALCMKGAT
jgi:GH24 family phage-related lysozyme (muramidase)